MKKNWPVVSLTELLEPVSRPEPVDGSKIYNILGAHWYAEGLYIKDTKLGSEISADRIYHVEQGDFVYNRLFAWKGSFAIVDVNHHGCYVSNEFPCFLINRNRLNPTYLQCYFSRAVIWNEALALSSGGTPTSRNRLKEDKLLAMEIPLPPVSEQSRIVKRIKELAARIGEATELHEKSVSEIADLYRGALDKAMTPNDAEKWKKSRVGEIIRFIDAGWSPQCEDRPARVDEWGVLKTTSVQWGEFRENENKVLPATESPIPKLAVEEGDVLVTRAGPRKRVGVVATVRKSASRLMISDKLIRIRPDTRIIDPRFLELSLMSPLAQQHLFEHKTGLADAQVNISQSILKATPIAFPILPKQKIIIEKLEVVRIKAAEVKQIQFETSKELRALLPSILNKAFNGEL